MSAFCCLTDCMRFFLAGDTGRGSTPMSANPTVEQLVVISTQIGEIRHRGSPKAVVYLPAKPADDLEIGSAATVQKVAKAYECTNCGRSFVQKANLKKHFFCRK